MIDRNYLDGFFVFETEFIAPCPYCNDGKLIIQKEKFINEEDFDSIEDRRKAHDPETKDQFDWEPDYYSGKFVALLKCNRCNNKVAVSGTTSLTPILDEDDYPGHAEYCVPRSFSPPIKIINFPKSERIDWDMKNLINKSFEIFWVDESACANKIRIALEKLLDLQNINRENQQGQKLQLHKRIELFKQINEKLGELLMTLKIFGNEGSHSVRKIEKNDLLDAYEILEYILFELYESQSKRIEEMSNRMRQKYHN